MYVIRDKKSGIYKYKREYPAELRDAIGKHWFVSSLQTKDRAEADKRYKAAHEEFEQKVEEYALHQYTVPHEAKVSLLHELRERSLIARSKQDVTVPDVLNAQRTLKKWLRSVMDDMEAEGEDYSVFSPATKGYQPAKQMAECYRDLLFRIENAIRAAKGEDAIERGAFVASGAALTSAPSRPTLKHASVRPAAYVHGLRITEAFELWKKDADPQAKTITDWGFSIRRFVELHDDVPVAAITKNMCKEYRDAIKELPIIPSNKTRARPIKELQKLAAAGELDMSDMPSNRTVNKMLDGLRAVIQVAIDTTDELGHMQNPVARLALKKKKKYNRVGFSEEDLKTLLASPLYRGCAGDNARNVPGEKIVRDGLFWIPLLSLFSGARQEEIAQLHLSDIHEDAPIPHYSINAYTDNRRVKNDESQRLIPIHQELIKCGFRDYVRNLRKQKQVRVFPELQRGNLEQRYAKNFSKQFNTYLVELGIKPPRESRVMKDFHSYRHLFKTACRRAKIPAEFHHFLTGHVGGKVVGDDYGEYPLETRNECMQQVRFEFLDLTHLYEKAPPVSGTVKKKKRLKLRRVSSALA